MVSVARPGRQGNRMTEYRLFEDQRLPGPLPVTIAVPDGWGLFDSPLPQALLCAIEPPADHYRENLIVSVVKATPVEEVLELGTQPLLDGDPTGEGKVMAEHLSPPMFEGGPTGAGFRTVNVTVQKDGESVLLSQTHFAAQLPVNFDRAVPRTLAIVATAELVEGGDPAPSLTRAREIALALGFPTEG